MDSREYRRAIADVLVEAAKRGIIPTELRVGKRYKLADMRTVAGAQMLVNSLVANDMDRERWAAVAPLQDPIGRCVQWVRNMERAERYQAEAEAELAELRRRALADLAATSPGAATG